MGFKATTHEPCLYFKYGNEGIELILRQVDDFKISAKNVDICNKRNLGSFQKNFLIN